jgi:hypothetical protein
MPHFRTTAPAARKAIIWAIALAPLLLILQLVLPMSMLQSIVGLSGAARLALFVAAVALLYGATARLLQSRRRRVAPALVSVSATRA